MKILVIEDDKTVGEYVRRGLDEAGYHVELVDDGDEGLRRASGRGANYDIMVLDLRLPKLSGIEVLRTLLDTGSREVTRDGKRIELTPKEYAVLEYLMRHQGRVMSRTLITEYAWDYHFDPGTNIVDVVITRLRKKIDQSREPKLIHTVRGVGYVVRT